MKIAVIGTGYVGLVTGTCLAETGNTVTCVDIDEQKVHKLKNGKIPIYEPHLDNFFKRNIAQKRLFFTTQLEEGIKDAQLIFLALPTPPGDDGSADLSYILSVAKELGKIIKSYKVIIDKSTVPVGTAEKVTQVIRENSSVDFDVVSNPEFLKEGAAIDDFMNPDRVVVGADSEFSLKKMKELYNPFLSDQDRFIAMDIRSAEMTKYAANAMLATKISFINEIANICEKVGADANQVRIGIGSDQRIGYSFINPGAGYGGSCFPKDVKALTKIAKENSYTAQLITAVEDVNDAQKLVIAQKIITRFGEDLSGFTFGIWGLAFKPGTDDMREAPSIYVIKELVRRGAKIKAYDPKAIYEAKEHYLKGVQNINYLSSKYDVLKDSDALVLLTEWKEFHSPDFTKIKKYLKTHVIFDGRNQYITYNLENRGIEYFRIGKK